MQHSQLVSATHVEYVDFVPELGWRFRSPLIVQTPYMVHISKIIVVAMEETARRPPPPPNLSGS